MVPSASLVKDINVTGGAGAPHALFSLNRAALFAVDDGVHPQALWRSDGTDAGTFFVKDLATGPNFGAIRETVVVGTVAYLASNQGGIWKTDGTANGTLFLSAPANPTDLTAIGNTLYFSASAPGQGNELWKSDGTVAGTTLVKDINPGAGGSEPFLLTAVGDKLFFAAADNAAGTHQSLWMSDGTSNGTVLVKDVEPASNNALSNGLSVGIGFGGKFYFSAFTLGVGFSLWVSDGTNAGTHSVQNFNLRVPTDFTIFNNQLFVSAQTATSSLYQLYKTDGTDAGTVLVQSDSNPYGLSPQDMTAASNQFFFAGRTAVNGVELWRSDGTTAGTRLLADINHNPILPAAVADPASSLPDKIVTIGNVPYFTADDGQHGIELWRSDGTAAGTTLVKDILPFGTRNLLRSPQGLTVVGNQIFFTAEDAVNGRQLWVSDGTTAGTKLVKVITVGNNGAFNRSGNSSIVFHGFALFAANDGINGDELWRSDGTTAGTFMVKDIDPGAYGSQVANLTVIGDTVYFTASSDNSTMGLWKTDGTSAGTVLVKQIGTFNTQGNLSALSPGNLTAVGNTFYFTGNNQLWKSDGTPAGTNVLASIQPTVQPSAPGDAGSLLSQLVGIIGIDSSAEVQSVGPRNLTAVGDTLFFTADDDQHGRELWKTDGTSTVLVKDITAGPAGANPLELTNVNGTLFFAAIGQLWTSNGTEAGTTTLMAFPGSIVHFVGIDNRLYFTADDGVNGLELWTSNGTLAGTTMVKDINPNAPGSSPQNLTNVGASSSSLPTMRQTAPASGAATARRSARSRSRRWKRQIFRRIWRFSQPDSGRSVVRFSSAIKTPPMAKNFGRRMARRQEPC